MKKPVNHSFYKYLNITPLEERWGLYVTTVGYSKVEPHENYPNQEHPQSHQLTWNRGRILRDFYLIFISKGRGVFCSAFNNSIEVQEGSCFLLFPDVWHRYKPDIKSGWEEYWIGFHGYYADQFMNKDFFSRNQPCIHIGLDKDLLVLFNKILDRVKAALPGYSQQIAGITMEILGLVNTLYINKSLDHRPVEKLISKAKFLLHESFENSLDMEELAAQLPMGYASFRKNFKLLTGYAPQQYHLNLRIERAKELLESTILNIEEVAEQTGFETIYYFSKAFKRKTGVSPSLYRKQINESCKYV